MPGVFPINAISRALHRRHRDHDLSTATSWPLVDAKLLKPVIVTKDELAEGTAAQDSQVEIPYYFTLEGEGPASGYFGGHVRSGPMSYSEASRMITRIEEGAAIRVRYNPQNPDQCHTLAADNEGLPFQVWPS